MTSGQAEPPDPATDLSEQFREHAAFCDRAAAPLYGHLMRGFADDWDAGGVVADLCGPWVGARRGHVVQLRVLGALHRLVLTRQAPLLATYYRSVGGTAAPDGVWPVARDVLTAHREQVRAELDVAPQTNEPGRSAALVVGLLHACARHGLRRVRLLELGASAGLNLRVAAFRVTGPGWAWGPAGSPVDLTGAVQGRLPAAVAAMSGDGSGDGSGAGPGVEVVAARGCDLSPVDPTTAQGRLRLTSFVWPDHVDRFERLRAALAVAATGPVTVDRADAASWLPDRLAEPVDPGVLTVVWHSVVRQYVPASDWRRVEDAVGSARARLPLAHVALESGTAPYDADPVVTVDGTVVASAPPHGVPVRLAGDDGPDVA